MISAFLFAVAAGNFVPPSFTQTDARQLQEGYRGGDAGIVLIDAHIDPKGRIADCQAHSLSGSKDLAASVCERTQRIKLTPASIDGRSAHGVVKSLLVFSDSGPLGDKADAIRIPADMVLQVNRLPDGQSALRVVAVVLVNASGKPQACYAGNGAPQAYADVACTQVNGVTFGTLKDDKGQAVRYVRNVLVDFSVGSPPDRTAAPGG